MKDWLLENGVTHVAMESTGIYGKPVYHVLEPTSLKVWIVNARHIYLLGLIRQDIASTEAVIKNLNARIKEGLSGYDNVLENLKAIPGLSTKTVEDLVAEISLDMSIFPTEKHLVSWAGMCPGNDESAGKKKWKNYPWEQTSQSSNNGSSVGCNKD
jgi:transposase